MLWNIIYAFFVKYIFGGNLYENGAYTSYMGLLSVLRSGQEYTYSTTFNQNIQVLGFNISFGNYLSLIATIISIVAIVILCCLLIKKIYNICAHVIG